MERRLVKQGRNALTMTLPSSWIKSHGLNAGDSVHVEIGNEELNIRTQIHTTSREITIDVHDQENTMIWHRVWACYIEGYDTIVVNHNNPTGIQKIATELIGMMIQEHTSTRTILKSIISVPEKTLDALFTRILHMFHQHSLLLVDVASENRNQADVKNQERLLDSTISYALRYLNKYEQHHQRYRYFLYCTTIECAADSMSRIAEHIHGQQTIAHEVEQIVGVYTSCVLAHDFQSAYTKIRALRTKLKHKTFLDGLVYSFVEIIYNNLGYLLAMNE